MRVKIKNTTIFGTFIGYDKKGKAIIVDEETNEIKKYNKSHLIKTYEKGE
tara:strand:- start:667 stop:816 length:150 start_codon:yes stop_codon:yes gene_type:complete